MLFFYLFYFSFQPFSLLENLLTFNSSNSHRFTVNYYRAKKKRNLSTVEKITRVVAVLMLIGTLGAIILQVALTAMNYK